MKHTHTNRRIWISVLAIGIAFTVAWQSALALEVNANREPSALTKLSLGDNTYLLRRPREKKTDKDGAVDVSEEAQVTGKVTDENGEPLPGANVVEKGTTNGTITDVDGRYALTVSGSEAVIEISYIGYEAKSTVVGDRTTVDFQLQPSTKDLETLVVIGYGSRKKEDVLGAVVKVDNSSFKDLSITSIDQGLVAQLPGVDVVQTTGEPGANAQFRIRGMNSITAGNDPLIVVDGIPLTYNSSLSSINPNDVESVNVLKDAAAASIYGSRGANGVVLITTKKGTTGKPKFSFNTYFGFQEVSKKVDMMDAYEYADYANVALRNEWIRANPDAAVPTDPKDYRLPSYIIPYLDKEKGLAEGLTNTNWQDEIYRTAPLMNFELSARGGTEKTRYYVSVNYIDQQGILVATDFKRANLRANIDAELSPKLTLGVNLSPSYSIANRVNDDSYGNDGIILSALVAAPFFPVRREDGSYDVGGQIKARAGGIAERAISTIADVENPVALAEMIDQVRQEYRLLGSGFINYEIIAGLNIRSQFSADVIYRTDSYFNPSTIGTRARPAPDIPRGTSATRLSTNWTFENTLEYNKRFESGHRIGVLLGYTAQRAQFSYQNIAITDFPNDEVRTLNAGNTVTTARTTISEYSLLSQLARVSYDFRDKYLIMATVRRDGSSRFRKDNRYGVFPSVSVGYRITQESFFPENTPFSEIKLRASWGISGNFFIPNNGAISLLSATVYPFGGEVNLGLSKATLPSTNLSWKKTETVDVGLDLSLWEGKVGLTADYYQSKTLDMLFNMPVPAQSGYIRSLQNLGRVDNKGFELGLTGRLEIGKLIWEPSLTYSMNKHEVVELSPDQRNIREWYFSTETGGELGAYYGYKNLGVFKSQEELDNYPHQKNAGVGTGFRWQDTNGDGVITAADKTYIGSFYPDYTLNFASRFAFRGIDFNFILQVVQGFEIVNITADWTRAQDPWSNKHRDMMDYYSADNPDAKYLKPNYRTRPDRNFFRRSDLFIEDGSFVRIRNITLGYTIPKRLTEKIGVDKFRIYASISNPFTFTNYSGPNPEISSRRSDVLRPGVDYGTFPLAKTYTLGLNVNF